MAAVRVVKHSTKCPWGSKTDVLRESGATGGVDGGRSRGKTQYKVSLGVKNGRFTREGSVRSDGAVPIILLQVYLKTTYK